MLEDSELLAIDVGGTNTRAWFDNREKYRKISSVNGLKEFITEITEDKRPPACAIGFAGPVVSRSEAFISNWPDSPVIRIDDLYDWGLPRGSTLMLNDMEAGAYGVISMDEEDGEAKTDCICLYTGETGKTDPLSSNKVLLAPGTGMGTIGIVSAETRSGQTFTDPVASEIQHSPAFAIDEIHGALIAWMKENICNGGLPNWEDFVSGRGLVSIYRGLGAVLKIGDAEAISRTDDPAAWIAANAVTYNDAGCAAALNIYYRCMAKVAQLLALAFQPFGGIYLSGESTIRNLPFIQQSKFISELQDNSRLRRLLERFPVYVITQKELNIRGALWACRERIHH